MAKRQFQLDDTEIRRLRRREQQTDSVAELKRLQAVRLYGSGIDMRHIRDMTGCAESSIREWVQDYKREGLEGLRPHYEHSARNASKLTAAQRAEVHERLHAYQPDQILAPTLRVSAGQFWTVSDLHLALEVWYSVVYNDPGSYRDVFAACEFSYQRTERVYKSRPSQAQIADFEAELEKKVTDFVQDHPQRVILALDQMSAYLQASLTRVWWPIGQTPYVWVTPQRDCIHFYGALDVISGQEVALSLPKLDSDHTLWFLEHVLACFPGRDILLLLDRALWHHGQARQFVLAHPHLDSFYFLLRVR